MKIDKVFFENTIFVISSIQEAEGLAILARGYKVNYCVLLTYIDYSEDDLEIMKAILALTNIENTFLLKLWLIQRYFDDNDILLKKISWNQSQIQAFNNKVFKGALFSLGYNIVCNIYSPFVHLLDYDRNKIIIMEHSPFNSFSKLRTCKKSCLHERDKSLYSFFMMIAKKCFKRRGFNAYKNMAIKFYIRKKYPLITELANIEKRFSWSVVNNQDFFYLDARKYILPQNVYHRCKQVKDERGIVLLLVDYPKMFLKEAVVYEQAKNVDYVSVYKNIVRSHVREDMTIIYKLHPKIFANVSPDEIANYQKQLEMEFQQMGYRKIYEFNSIICDEIVSKFPVECFIYPLSINKVVGIFSSVMEVVRYWEDIEVIADLRFVPFMKKIWRRLYDGLPMPNYKVLL